jgi:hypothetical protein
MSGNINTNYINNKFTKNSVEYSFSNANETSFFANKNVVLEEEKISNPNPIENNIIIKKKRCNLCNKRLTLAMEFTCKCSGIFCSSHKYPDTHKCSFDHKAQWKKSLKEKNPTVAGEKLEKI